jgi:serine/threonine-protein kinase
MGRVELAIREEGHFRRIYAVKRLREGFVDDEAVREMFLDEARIAGLIHHPNVVSVLDVGVDPDGPYLVMDFVRGISLARLLQWAHEREELLPVQLCTRIVRQIADGLHTVHELRDGRGNLLQVVHRDVSPQNILLGYDGAARLADFGVARARGRLSRTHTGVLKGKYGYMSPEQLRFEEPDRRADIFALGVVFYELLASTRLYRRDDGAAAARAILNDPPPDIDEVRKDVHPSLVELLFRMLAKHPADRPQSGREIVRILDEVLATQVMDESTLSLGDFLEEHFGEHKRAQEAELEHLRTTFRRPITGALALPPERPDPTPSRGMSSRRAVALAFVSATIAAVAAAAAVWIAGSPDTDAPEPLEVAAPPVSVQPEASDAVDADDREALAATAEPDPAPEPSSADVVHAEPSEGETEETPRRRRRRGRSPRMQTRMQAEMAPSGELYGWGE